MTLCLNFLPESYKRQRAKRKRIGFEVLLVAAAVAGAAMWFVAAQSGVSVRHEQTLAMEAQAAEAQESLDMLEALKIRDRRLKQQLRLEAVLAQPVTHTQVVATLGRLLPDSVALLNLDLTARRQKQPTRSEVEQRRASAAKRGKHYTNKEADSTDECLQAVVTGIAPSDDDVADAVGALSGFPAFEQVKLQYTQPVQHDGLVGRSFRLTFKVPLGRRYERTASMPAASHEGVSDAH